MKEIHLTRGFVAVVDDVDYDRLAVFSWDVRIGPGGLRYARRAGPLLPSGKCSRPLMHQEILPVSPGRVVIHKDGDGLNNRRANLIEGSYADRMHNRRGTIHSSPYKGVSWMKQKGKWRARIHDSREVFIGLFDSDVEAAMAYDEAAYDRWGNFALLNFPDRGRSAARHDTPMEVR